jgi:hypothetical protein
MGQEICWSCEENKKLAKRYGHWAILAARMGVVDWARDRAREAARYGRMALGG